MKFDEYAGSMQRGLFRYCGKDGGKGKRVGFPKLIAIVKQFVTVSLHLMVFDNSIGTIFAHILLFNVDQSNLSGPIRQKRF